MASKRTNRKLLPLIGDAIAIMLLIIIGLRFHQSEGPLIERLIINFLPFLVAWLLAASAVGLLNAPRAADWNNLWRVVWAAALAAPLGAALRGFWLGQPVLPVFILVMGITISTGLLIWRSIFIGFIARVRFSK